MSPRRSVIAVAAALVAGCFGTRVDQSPECAAYVACIRALDRAAGLTTDLERYVESGACWRNETLGTACTTSCERALSRLTSRVEGLPQECVR